MLLNNGRKAVSGGLFALLFLSRPTYRAGDVTIFVDEVQELSFALDCVGNKHLSFTFSRLRFLTNVAVTVDVVKEAFVIALKIELLDFLSHRSTPYVVGW